MAKVKLSWTAPTTNVDGTPIVHKLDYELGIKDASGNFTPYLVVVGDLQPNNEYMAAADIEGIPYGEEVELALRAINTKDTAETQDDLYSAWSLPVAFVLSNGIPKAPDSFNATVTDEMLVLVWAAPTANTDETPVVDGLEFELGLKGEDGEFAVVQGVEGEVAEDGTFTAELDGGSFQKGIPLELAVRAVNTKDTEILEDDLKSEWSASVSVLFSSGVPNAPENFGVASE